MDKAQAIAVVFRASVPLVCIAACVGMAIIKPESTAAQMGLLTMGATAYQPNKQKEGSA